MKQPPSKTAESIRTFRKSKGWTQRDLAKRLNMSERSITMWETGSVAPSGSSLLDLAAIFEVEPSAFLDSPITENIPQSAPGDHSRVGSAATAVFAVLQGAQVLSDGAIGRLIHRVMKRAEAEGRAADQPMAREELQAMLAEMLG